MTRRHFPDGYARIAVLCLSALVLAAGCAKKETEVKQPEPEGPSRKYAEMVVKDRGTVILELDMRAAPKTAGNFVKLAENGFYDTLTFHRVEPGFVVQGGDPKGDGTGNAGYNLPFEQNNLKHIEGALAMARAQDRDSASCQFYITLAPQPDLDGNYVVFGRVAKGMDVVKRIERGDVIQSITLHDRMPGTKSTPKAAEVEHR